MKIFHVEQKIDLDRTFKSLHGEAAVYYSLTDKVDIILLYGGNQSSFLGQTNAELSVRENACFGRTWNYGPLGGFTIVDVSAGYRFSSYLIASAQVVNVFDTKMREFVASLFIGRLYSAELKVMIPAIGSK